MIPRWFYESHETIIFFVLHSDSTKIPIGSPYFPYGKVGPGRPDICSDLENGRNHLKD